jgi:FixJ family two-component response regulator
MPGMTGPELQRELAIRQKKIPTIFITGQRDETLRPRLLKLGAVECLSKAFSEPGLEEAINAALRIN